MKKEKLACAPKDYDFYGFFFSLSSCRFSISSLKCVAVHSYLNLDCFSFLVCVDFIHSPFMQFGYFCFVSLFQFRVLVVCSAFFSAVLSGGETNFAANTWNQKKRVRIVIFWFKYVIRCVNTKAHRQINMSFTCLVFVIKRLLLLQYICGAMTVYVAYCFACLYVVLCCFVIFCNEYRKSLCHNDAVFTAPSLSLSLSVFPLVFLFHFSIIARSMAMVVPVCEF